MKKNKEFDKKKSLTLRANSGSYLRRLNKSSSIVS